MTLTLGNPFARIADGDLLLVDDVDLAFDPNQKRDGEGRWVDDPSVSELSLGGPEWDGQPTPVDHTRETVRPKNVRFQRYPVSDARVQSAIRGYRSGADMPPVILVSRAGEMLTEGGHHRLTAAEILGISIPAVIAHSPLADRYTGRARIGTLRKPRNVDLAFDPNQKRDDEGRWVDLVHNTPERNQASILMNGFRAGRGEGGYGAYFSLEGSSYEGRSGEGTVNIRARFHAQKTLVMTDDKNDPGYQRYVEATWDDSERPDKVLAKQGYDSAEYHDPWGNVQFIVFDPSKVKIKRDADLAFDPNQKRGSDGRWVANAANIVSKWDQATPGERTAGEQWYPMAHLTALALAKKYDVTKEEAAGLLATYSPQTPWGRNQIEASEALRYGHGVGGKYGAVWFTHDDPTVEDRVGIMATGGTRSLADKVIAGGDFDTLTAGRNKDGSLKPGSPKIRAFYHLIAAGGQDDPEHPRVVIDRHAMSVAYGERVTNDEYTKMRPGSAKKYKPFVDAYVEAARQISESLGHTVSPEMVQATTWLVQQRQNAAMLNSVGKTRKALGHRDWNEWTKYAARYLGLDTANGAKVGYTNLAKVIRDEVIDLAFTAEFDLRFNPGQPRDEKGRWSEAGRHAAGVQTLLTTAADFDALPVGATFTGPLSPYDNRPVKFTVTKQGTFTFPDSAGNTLSSTDVAYTAAMPGRRFTTDSASTRVVKGVLQEPKIEDPGDDFLTGLPAATPDEVASVEEQTVAQNTATNWFQQAYSPEAELWADYQNPSRYGEINDVLRESATDNGPAEQAASRMFAEGGYTTAQPMTVYRALRTSAHQDWADILKPGTTFEDDGIVSTTAFRRLAQGWLGLDGTDSRREHVKSIDVDDVVMEIRVPEGSRIVGGSTHFIETMLPPGTRLKVISSQRVRTPNAQNPISSARGVAPFTYTHVVVEPVFPAMGRQEKPAPVPYSDTSIEDLLAPGAGSVPSRLIGETQGAYTARTGRV